MFVSKEITTMTHLIELHGLVVDQNLHSEQSQIAMTACRVWKPNYLMYSVHHSWGSQLCVQIAVQEDRTTTQNASNASTGRRYSSYEYGSSSTLTFELGGCECGMGVGVYIDGAGWPTDDNGGVTGRAVERADDPNELTLKCIGDTDRHDGAPSGYKTQLWGWN